jgi:acyl-CoA thioesterase
MTLFNQDIKTIESAPGVFTGTVSENWLVNGNPNGGYLMALMTRAILARNDNMRTPIVTANYIARCVPGPAQIRIEQISSTKQFHRFEARLFQEEKEKVRALATFALENNECVINRYETPPTPLAPRESCVLIPALPTYTLFEQLDVLLDPACAGWMQNRLVDRSENKGWIRFKYGNEYDLLSLLLIADSLPPAVMATHGIVAWVPTIELSVNIRNLPQSEWLNCCLRTRFITCGLLEADGEIWDEAGNLIAISRQIAQVRKL